MISINMDSQRVRGVGGPPAGDGGSTAIHTVAERVPSVPTHDGNNDDTCFTIPPEHEQIRPSWERNIGPFKCRYNLDDCIAMSRPPFQDCLSDGWKHLSHYISFHNKQEVNFDSLFFVGKY